MHTVLYCTGYDTTDVESSMGLPKDTVAVTDFGSLKKTLERLGNSTSVVFALDSFDQRIAKLAKGLESAKYKVEVVSFDQNIVDNYVEYVEKSHQIAISEFGAFFGNGYGRIDTNRQLNRASLGGVFGADKYRVVSGLISGHFHSRKESNQDTEQAQQVGEIKLKKKKQKQISVRKTADIAPVPVVEAPVELTRKTSSGNWTWATEAIKSVFASDNKPKLVITERLSTDGLIQEDSSLDDMLIEMDTSMFDFKVYTTPMECLIDTGVISKATYSKLVEMQESTAAEKGVRMSLEDFAILTKAVKESDVLNAMRRVYHTDFLSYKRLMEMKVLTNVFPKAVCKKYRFIHIAENPRVLVSTMDNKLTANLGSHFGDARILFSLQSIILARINAVEEWEHEGGSLS